MNIKLLKDLDFATKINEATAATSAGQDLLNNYKSYLFTNSANCSLVNGFVQEASKYSYDTGLIGILESVNKYINENKISWQLASACESISESNSPYGYINKVSVSQVQKILEMNETDVVSYIKAGALKGVQYVPEFRNICKQVYKAQINESHKVNYDLTTPISFVLVDENNSQYFNIGGHNFVVTENAVSEVNQVNDQTYNFMVEALNSFTKEGDNIYYEYVNPRNENIRFTFVGENLNFTKGSKIDETFDSSIKFIEQMNIISKIMPVAEKMQFMNICNTISKVFENIDNVVELDCAKLISTNNGFSGAIIEGKDNVNLTIFHSVNAGTSSNNYNYMAEALQAVTKMTGLDLAPMFESRIAADTKKIPTEEQIEIKEALEANKEAQYAIRRKKIALLAESFKNDPVKLSLLNKIAKDLKTLEK